MKKITYIVLTVLCLLSTVLLQYIPFYQPVIQKEAEIKIEIGKIISNIVPILASSLIYLLLFTFGIVNLIIFLIKKIKKQPISDITEERKIFPLSAESSSKLLFLISLFILLVSIAEIVILHYIKGTADIISLFLILNLILEIFVAAVIITFLRINFLNFTIKRKHLFFIPKIYTAILPIILLSLFINLFITEAIGIRPSINPAVKLILLLKSKPILLVLTIQIILFGPLAEELFFRGFIYSLLRKRYSFILSCLPLSLWFSLLHRSPQNILPLFIISTALCYLYEKTQSITAPVIFHSLFNSLNLMLILITKNLL